MADIYDEAEAVRNPNAEIIYQNIMRWYQGKRKPPEIWKDFVSLNDKYAKHGERDMNDLEKRRWNWYQRAARTAVHDGIPVGVHSDGTLYETEPIDPMPGSFWPDGVSMLDETWGKNKGYRLG